MSEYISRKIIDYAENSKRTIHFADSIFFNSEDISYVMIRPQITNTTFWNNKSDKLELTIILHDGQKINFELRHSNIERRLFRLYDAWLGEFNKETIRVKKLITELKEKYG